MLNTCYYCQKRNANDKFAYKTILYSKLDTEYGIGLLGIKKTTKYYEKEFSIERCEDCYKIHTTSNGPTGRIGLIFFVLSGSVTYVFAKRVFVTVIVSIIVAIIAMIIYIQLTYRKKLKSLGIKDANEITEYPPIKDLLSNGWQTLKP